jgi:hypothetical protein
MELYTHVSKDLQKWIEKSKEDYKEAEEEVQKVTPELFEEFRDTDEEGKAELLVRDFRVLRNVYSFEISSSNSS